MAACKESSDPLLVKKAFISHYFHEPISEIEDKFNLDEIDRYYTMAKYIIDSVYFAPFKQKK